MTKLRWVRLTPSFRAAAVTVSLSLPFNLLRVTLISKVIPLLMKSSTEKITSDTFSSRLRDLMVDQGIGQDDLAKALDVAQSTISSWIGGNEPKQRNLARLAKYFRVDPQWLSAGKEPKEIAISSDEAAT